MSASERHVTIGVTARRALVRRLVVALGMLVALAIGCDVEVSGPRDVFVLVRTESGEYSVMRRRLELTDVKRLRGPDFHYETADEIDVEFKDGTAIGSVTNAVPLELSLIEDDGAFAAVDYEGLVALSSAYHFVEGLRYFRALGLGSSTPPLPHQRIIFHARRVGDTLPFDNNAFFAPSLGGFGILRENGLDGLPLSSNAGIIVHELSHAVFAHLLAALLPSLEGLGDGFQVAALDEGIADVHAAASTTDPDFLGPSLRTQGAAIAAARDLSVVRPFTDDVLDPLNPYPLGSVIASAFWAYGRQVGLREMGQVAFDATRELGALDALPRATNIAYSLMEAFVHQVFVAATSRGHGAAWCTVASAQLSALVLAGDCP